MRYRYGVNIVLFLAVLTLIFVFTGLALGIIPNDLTHIETNGMLTYVGLVLYSIFTTMILFTNGGGVLTFIAFIMGILLTLFSISCISCNYILKHILSDSALSNLAATAKLDPFFLVIGLIILLSVYILKLLYLKEKNDALHNSQINQSRKTNSRYNDVPRRDNYNKNDFRYGSHVNHGRKIDSRYNNMPRRDNHYDFDDDLYD